MTTDSSNSSDTDTAPTKRKPGRPRKQPVETKKTAKAERKWKDKKPESDDWMKTTDFDTAIRWMILGAYLDGSGPMFADKSRPWTDAEKKRIAQLQKTAKRKSKFTADEYSKLSDELNVLAYGLWDGSQKFKADIKAWAKRTLEETLKTYRKK